MTNKMTQYNTLNVKVSDSKLNKIKSSFIITKGVGVIIL